MAEIQVDMFEVQLGASVLLQFKFGAGMVRVLADAGTSGGGYAPDHVLKKLQAVLPATGAQEPRIDLLVGTHYDADHLNQLVPIIARHAIGEAWLPPVANDTDEPAQEWEEPRQGDFLAAQFAAADGPARLSRYLQAKARHLGELHALRIGIDGADEDDEADEAGASYRALGSAQRVRALAQSPLDDAFFATHLADANAYLGEKGDHACEEVRAPRDAIEIAQALPMSAQAFRALTRSPRAPRAAARSLAYVQRSTAKDAINAKALFKVVEALKQRAVPMRFETVEDGKPALFEWNAARRRFLRAAARHPTRIGLTLLGPSRGLVRTHWQRLPQGSYRAFALTRAIPVEDITPSNQLSYAMLFGHRKQRLLITGDSGFVDFMPLGSRGAARQFYPEMIAALRGPLHVVQVAHHGGHNKYFYHALVEAAFHEQKGTSYLLLSHATRDKTRPSKAFSDFAEVLVSADKDARLLFTSKPRVAAVRSCKALANAPKPGSADADCGDIRLDCAAGKWTVRAHAVKV